MKPGKNLTPTPELDLEKLWRALKEEPPGNIRSLDSQRPSKESDNGRTKASRH